MMKPTKMTPKRCAKWSVNALRQSFINRRHWSTGAFNGTRIENAPELHLGTGKDRRRIGWLLSESSKCEIVVVTERQSAWSTFWERCQESINSAVWRWLWWSICIRCWSLWRRFKFGCIQAQLETFHNWIFGRFSASHEKIGIRVSQQTVRDECLDYTNVQSIVTHVSARAFMIRARAEWFRQRRRSTKYGMRLIHAVGIIGRAFDAKW